MAPPCNKQHTMQDHAANAQPSCAPADRYTDDFSAAPITVLRPGLVMIKGALDMEAQLRVARDLFETGHGQRRWWAETPMSADGGRTREKTAAPTPTHVDDAADDALSAVAAADAVAAAAPSATDCDGDGAPAPAMRWALNAERQGRGRCYDAVESFVGAPALSALCVGLAERSRAADAAMPPIVPTHLLALLYATEVGRCRR